MQSLNELLVVDDSQEHPEQASSRLAARTLDFGLLMGLDPAEPVGQALPSEEVRAAPQGAARPPSDLAEDRYQLGKVFQRCGILVEAVYHFIQGLRLNPQDERGYYALAQLAAQQGKRRMAHRVLRLGLRHVPDSWMLRHALAGLASAPLVSREQQKAQGALHARALELLDEGLPHVVLELMANAYQEGTLPSADLKVLEAGLLERLSPPQVSKALHAYEEALTLEPGHLEAFNQKVLLLLRQDGPEAPADDTRGRESASDDHAPWEPESVFVACA